jgi:hypothetical protein
MGIVRQSSFAILAVTVVVSSLVFLYPDSSVSATTVTLGSAGITSVDRGADDDGTTAADNFFDVTFSINLAAGEHIPLNYAEVRVAAAGGALDADGRLVATICNASTGGTPSAEIVSITGVAASSAAFVGTGYDVADDGYGFVFTDPSPVDFSGYNAGIGMGYGGSTPGGDLLSVTVRVTGCILVYDPVSSFADVRVQALVGATSTLNFWSTPADVSLFDPGFTTGTTTTTPVTLVGEDTVGGGEMSFEFQIDNTANLGTGTTLTLDLSGNTGSMGGAVSIVLDGTLPAGTTITLGFRDAETDPTADDDLDLINNPPFGISAAALAARTANPPAGFFTLSLHIPGQAETDENAFLGSLTITLQVPQAYATARGLAIPGGLARMVLPGFDDTTGELDSLNFPSSIDCVTPGPTFCNLTFTITQFSAFALVVGVPTGGGGGGPDPAPTTAPLVTTTVTNTGTDGVVSTTTITAPATGSDSVSGTDGQDEGGKKKTWIPGLEPMVLVAALVAVALLARRRLQ